MVRSDIKDQISTIQGNVEKKEKKKGFVLLLRTLEKKANIYK